MPSQSPRPLRRGPQRPPQRPRAPFSKGLGETESLPVKFPKPTLLRLRARAKYETLRWRLAHEGRGREISAQDIIRRLVDAFFRDEPAVPADAIGQAVRSKR